MMAEAIDWDDSATVSGQPVAADEAWHVAIAHDDVKVVSLEQLDDMFRLSLVDSETKVWQPGMTEWTTLGIIAGLEDKPPAPPKRTHPKPPSPRSAPPPPQRSAPPPAPRAPVAAASFYPEPVALRPAPISYAAPIMPLSYTAPIASVRPLVVSHNPYAVRQSGGGFGRFVVGLALLAGVGVTLYRNDVLRDAAHSIHQDGLYAQLEQRLGGPSFGTLRAVEQSANGEVAAASAATSEDTSAKADDGAVLANVVQTPTPNTQEQTPPRSGSSPPVVSLESLGTEKSGATSAKPEPKAVAPTATPTPVTKAASFVSAPIAKAAAPVAKAPPPPPEPKPAKAAPVEKPAPVSQKPESEMTPRERLNAEIAKAMTTSPASAKKSSKSKGGASDYDPLNPKL
jgi:hypothetical protein